MILPHWFYQGGLTRSIISVQTNTTIKRQRWREKQGGRCLDIVGSLSREQKPEKEHGRQTTYIAENIFQAYPYNNQIAVWTEEAQR